MYPSFNFLAVATTLKQFFSREQTLHAEMVKVQRFALFSGALSVNEDLDVAQINEKMCANARRHNQTDIV